MVAVMYTCIILHYNTECNLTYAVVCKLPVIQEVKFTQGGALLNKTYKEGQWVIMNSNCFCAFESVLTPGNCLGKSLQFS